MAEKNPQDDIMALAPMKQAFAVAQTTPIGCALALTADRRDVVLLLDRRAKPKKVAASLKKDGKAFIELNSLRFGRVSFLPEDPGTAHFQVNKSVAGGAIAHVVKLVKKAGYEAAVFDVNEALEAESDEEDPAASAATDGNAAAAAQPVAGQSAPPPPQSSPPPVENFDAEALKTRLSELARRMSTVIAGQPALRDTLLKLAKDAQLQLATNNFKAATNAADALQSALDEAVHGGTVREGMAESPRATDGALVAFAKSSQLWRACRTSVTGKMEQLKAAVIAAYADEPDVQAAVRQNIGKLDEALDGLDDRLDDALDAALNAADDAARAKAVTHARQVIADYIKTVASSQKLAAMDANPLDMPLGLKDTLSKTLSALVGLSKTMA